jgi:hypothetical protein
MATPTAALWANSRVPPNQRLVCGPLLLLIRLFKGSCMVPVHSTTMTFHYRKIKRSNGCILSVKRDEQRMNTEFSRTLFHAFLAVN